MTKKHIIITSIVAISLIIAAGIFFFFQNTSSGDGYISSTTGELSALRNQENIALSLGDGIYQNDIITTAEETTADITFDDGSKIRLAPSSTVDIKEFAYGENNSFVMNIIAGAVRTVTGEIVKRNPDAFKVNTPTAVLGIRGTEFFASVYDTMETFATFFIDENHTLLVEREDSELSLTEPLQITTTENEELSTLKTITLEEMENKIDSIAPTLSAYIPTSADEQGKWNSLDDYTSTIIKNYHNLQSAEVLSENNPYIVNITGNSSRQASVSTSSRDDIVNIGTTGFAETRAITVSTADGNDKINMSSNIAKVKMTEKIDREKDPLFMTFNLGSGDDLLMFSDIDKNGISKMSFGTPDSSIYSSIYVDMGTGEDTIQIKDTQMASLTVEQEGNLIFSLENSFLEQLAFFYDEDIHTTDGKLYKIDEFSYRYETDTFSNTFSFSENSQIDYFTIHITEGKHEITDMTFPQNIGSKSTYFMFRGKEPSFAFFKNKTLNLVPYTIIYEGQSAIVLGENVQATSSGLIAPIFLAGGTVTNLDRATVLNTHSENFRINSTAEYEALGLNYADQTLQISKSFWSGPVIISDNDPYVPKFTITFTANNGFTLQLGSSVLASSLPKTIEEVQALIKENDTHFILDSAIKARSSQQPQ